MDHLDLMDKIYRYQRYIYDVTRKYFLFGRDALIEEMDIKPGDHVLEMGCGTGRNLVLLARRHPSARFYGLDASAEMLEQARRNFKRAGIESINLAHCLAEDLNPKQHFSLAGSFDVVFFSYSLSMIPTWSQALTSALVHLKPGGSLYIVDFWDQQELPGAFRSLLSKWLKLFHVRHDPALIRYLESMESSGCGELTLTSIMKRYAFLARFARVDLKHPIDGQDEAISTSPGKFRSESAVSP